MKKNRNFKIVLIAITGTLVPIALLLISSMLIYGPKAPLVKFYYWKGFIEQRNGNLESAIKNFDKATELNKEYPTAYISRGSAYLDIKEYGKAIENYSTAIKLSPENEEPYAYRGRAYYEIDSLKNSKNDFDMAIKLNGNFGYAYSNRALLKYTKLNDQVGACEDLKKAAELGDSDAKSHLKDGVCN
ncbi:tetratricopeptide repeat protein [Flavobacterium fluviatile]|uniref:tetratricopeptide repeat protein n=1 Tax=Flavobacterium fluviatile TaxID=1862387 RepID=UPI0013D2FE79|nr:tetratricopeptide repeat protein [Flavobacterium fluviatile]